ncbi:MAG: hypothetical protein RL660_698 [Bacteroidota bacterium]|jgi:hypothetical protein
MALIDNLKATYAGYNNWRELVNDLGYKGIVKNLGFILYCTVLLLLCITVIHRNENRIRNLVDANKQLKEKTWEYKDEKRKLMFMTKESELAQKAQAQGLVLSNEVPQKIVITQNSK